ncbi:hypothetical protein [uncultured Microscilla sp.]|uniref:hypothetical protein n=1 Tax=uncultured Microscilla sp. TaxID=432653 RepID=UPI00263A3262|nr:hypothetical protein [uncultured Microscilla sp.]
MENKKVIISEQDGVQHLKTIFRWMNSESIQEHCLLRLFIWKDTPKVIVVISELKSNADGSGVALGFYGLSEMIIERFRRYLAIDKCEIEWFLHYGGFSAHESLGNEILEKVIPEIVHEFGFGKLPETIRIKSNFSEYLSGIELGKMRPILKELNWELQDGFGDPEWE